MTDAVRLRGGHEQVVVGTKCIPSRPSSLPRELRSISIVKSACLSDTTALRACSKVPVASTDPHGRITAFPEQVDECG